MQIQPQKLGVWRNNPDSDNRKTISSASLGHLEAYAVRKVLLCSQKHSSGIMKTLVKPKFIGSEALIMISFFQLSGDYGGLQSDLIFFF